MYIDYATKYRDSLKIKNSVGIALNWLYKIFKVAKGKQRNRI